MIEFVITIKITVNVPSQEHSLYGVRRYDPDPKLLSAYLASLSLLGTFLCLPLLWLNLWDINL